MCQQEYVIHANAQCQEGQHLEGHGAGSWRNRAAWAIGPQVCPAVLMYLGSGGIEGDAEQGAEPEARGHR